MIGTAPFPPRRTDFCQKYLKIAGSAGRVPGNFVQNAVKTSKT
mgnify:CR=1 FL=1